MKKTPKFYVEISEVERLDGKDISKISNNWSGDLAFCKQIFERELRIAIRKYDLKCDTKGSQLRKEVILGSC